MSATLHLILQFVAGEEKLSGSYQPWVLKETLSSNLTSHFRGQDNPQNARQTTHREQQFQAIRDFLQAF